MHSLIVRLCRDVVVGILVFASVVGAEDAPPPVTVSIKDFAFAPAMVKIKTGQPIIWINSDDEPHTIAANDKAYRSPTLDTGESFTRTFATAGEFAYFCTLHPHMIGKIVVENAAP